MQNSTPSQRETKTFGKNSTGRRCWSIYRFYKQKHLLMKLLSESTNICNSFVGIDTSQLYAYSICQPIPTGLYARWDIDSGTSRFTPRKNKTSISEEKFMSSFQRTRPDCKFESFYTKGRQKKIDNFSADEFSSHCHTVYEAMGCFYDFCPCQGLRPSLTVRYQTWQ